MNRALVVSCVIRVRTHCRQFQQRQVTPASSRQITSPDSGWPVTGSTAALRDALKDPYTKVRFHVSYCLVQIDRGDKAAAQEFLAALPRSGLPKSYPITRIGVLRTLGDLAARDRAAVPVLRDLLQGESDRVWVALADVLKKLNGTP